MASVWKLGVDAASMVALPDVVGVSSPYQRVGGSHVSLSGAQTIDQVAVKKAITLTFDYCTDADYDTIAQFFDGRKGLGPFLYQDPRETVTRTVNITDLSDDSDLEGYRTGPQLNLQEV